MSKFKNIPGLVWLVIGVLVTLLVIPTTAYAAGALKFVGIEGTSTNKADVSPAGQLLTTEANPTMFRTYIDDTTGVPSFGCSAVTTTLPTGDALDLRDVSVSTTAANVQTTASG